MKKLPTSFPRGPGTQGLPKTEADQNNRTPPQPQCSLVQNNKQQPSISWGAARVQGDKHSVAQLCRMTAS